MFYFFFFFFQAEDGIRDLTVTGVQTCALPIFCASVVNGSLLGAVTSIRCVPLDNTPSHVPLVTRLPSTFTVASAGEMMRNLRSEERRVGKECRSRWSR